MIPQKGDHDPLRKVQREAGSFNLAWLKHGERMTWTQRIGIAIFSFVLFSAGLIYGTYALADFRTGDFLGAVGWLFPALILGAPGCLGIRNVLRF